jgi:beta-lactamase regulating signal transducer with metallopeptidase domain/tetratricopeptide (TPR) repeat protein
MNGNLSILVRFGLDVVVKATVLFALTAVALFLLKRSSASVRQLVASLGLAGALALPAVSLLAPRWEVPLFRDPVPETAPTLEDLASRPAPVVGDSAAAPKFETIIEKDVPARVEAAPADAPRAVETWSTSDVEPIESAPKPPSSPVWWMIGVLALWTAGTLLSAARIVFGSVRIAGIRAEASEADEHWSTMAAELSGRLGLARPVRLFFSAHVAVPVTAGLRHPMVLLPEGARRWNDERRRVVLLHELAHVRRADWVALLVGQAASAVYWFHPLAWLTRVRMQKDCERACDDLVLASGTRPSVYAAHLLSIIRSLRLSGQRALPAVAMAHRSYWDGRMRAILDPVIVRKGVSGREARAAGIALAAAVATLAVLQPWAPRAEAMVASDRTMTEGDVDLGAVAAQLESSSSASTSSSSTSTSSCPNASKKAAPAAAPSASRTGSVASLFPMEPANVAAHAPEVVAAPVEARALETSATSGFVQAGSKHKRSSSNWYSHGMELHQEGRYDEAIEAFEHAIGEGNRVDAATYNIACGYALKGDPARAVEWLRKSLDEGFELSHYIDKDDDLDGIRSDPRFVELRRNLRAEESEAEKHHGERLARKLAEMQSSKSTRGSAFYALGKDLLNAESYDASARAFQESAARGFREGASLYNTACALSRKGDKAGALSYLEKSLEAGFDDVGLFRKDDDLDNVRGEPRYRELLKMAQDLELHRFDDWGSMKSWTRAGRRNAWRETEQHFAEYVQRHPQSGRAWYNLGYARIEGDRPEASVEAFQRALDLRYRSATTMYNLACAYSLLDRQDEAFAWLFKALDAGFDGSGTLRSDDDLDNLRGDPRYRQALTRVKTFDDDDD